MATGTVQQFCLRWNNHQPNFISVFSNLFNNESLVDVTLAAEGKHLQAHKIVLSACSSYFQSLFTINPCKHPIVILKDIKYADLKILVDFMYCGEVNVSQEQLPAVLKTAETLKVKGLAEMPEHNISLTAAAGDKNSESSPTASPSMLRRKRLRKSSTGSGSGSTEQTTGGSEETTGSGVPSPSQNQVKMEPNPSENEGSLRHEPSTESEPGFASQESVEDEPASSVQQSSEDRSEGGQKSSTSMDDSNTPSTSSQPHYSSADVPSSGGTMGSKRGRLLMRQHRVKKENDVIQGYECDEQQLSPQPSGPGSGGLVTSGTNSTTSGTSVSMIPRVIERQCSEPAHPSQNPMQASPNLLSVPQPSFLVKQHSSPLLLSSTQSSSPSLHVHLVTPSTSELGSSSISVRPKEELRRTASSPQCSTVPSEFTESRSCHCPVLRPGPALGCNFCWNTIDAHGRILRRKTKYHCPECQANLCIVPCFQEYHERHCSETRVVVPIQSGSNNTSGTVVPTIMKTSSM